jgi:hypothetical protein
VSEPTDNGKAEKVHSLTDAIRRVRTAEAERSDVVVEMRDAERARLELLADELKEVFADVPADNESFLFTIAEGLPPRLWIDMTAFVAMGRDRRTYRFLKDTRLGRTVILETHDIVAMADCVTNYVAERIIERERSIEGDWLVRRVKAEAPPKKSARQIIAAARPTLTDRRNLGWVVAAFLGGMLLGLVALLAWAWVRVG